MRNLSIILAGMLVLAMVFGCQNKQQEPTTGNSVTLTTRTIQQNKGTDCEKQPDSLRMDCAIVDFTVPKVAGTVALSKSVDTWVDKFLIHLLIYSDYPETDPSKAQPTVEAAIKRFHEMHDDSKPSIAGGQFKAMCTHGELLNDGKYLTLMLDGYSFQGGNHHLEDMAIATFDVKTGKQLSWTDLLKVPENLLPIAQTRVRTERADAFEEGFEFDKTEPFKLPNAYGLVAEGLLMHYSPDEIYQLGGVTEFIVPFGELGTNLKVVAPIAPAVEIPEVDISSLYEVVGDSLVIPPFEVEVRESAKTMAELKKRKETVIVGADFMAFPKDPKEKAKGEEGFISLHYKQLELKGGNRIARFEGLKFHKSVLDKAEDQDISLLINVFSGRTTTENNLLSCGLVDAKASIFKNRRFSVGCLLIEEDAVANPVTIAFALPETGNKPTSELPLVVDCSEKGELSLAGMPVKDMAELKVQLTNAIAALKATGMKTVPAIQTEGCLMGMQGAIRDLYEELKTGGKPATAQPTEASTESSKVAAEKSSSKEATATKPAPKTTQKSASKPATKPAKPASPSITLNEKGVMTLDGKKVDNFDELRKQLQSALLTYDIIPDEVPIQTSGTTGMGTRAEMRTEITDAIKGAKWLRKKAAIAAVATPVGKKLGTEVELEVAKYQTSGNFSFLEARPKTKDGKAIDYATTPYKADAASGKFADKVLALLQYSNGSWKVLAYNIGTSTVPVDAWVKTYKAPKALFGK